MTEKDTKNRRWFQVHLSTAVVMMFAAAGLLWANTRPPTLADHEGRSEDDPRHMSWFKVRWQAWPKGFAESTVEASTPNEAIQVFVREALYPEYYWGCMLENAFYGVCMVLGLGMLNEYFVRRQIRRNQKT